MLINLLGRFFFWFMRIRLRFLSLCSLSLSRSSMIIDRRSAERLCIDILIENKLAALPWIDV